MAKALGIGGVFFKSNDPEKLAKWYNQWLSFKIEQPEICTSFQPSMMPPNAVTVWSPFQADTNYFAPSSKEFMINIVVDKLDDALSQVKAGGAQVMEETENHEFGRFGWFIDPEGNKVELWEPIKEG